MLDTATLGVTDLLDYDKGTSSSLNIGLSYLQNAQGSGSTDGKSSPSGTISGSFAQHDRRQITSGTIGAGPITIRDPAGQAQDVASINRDPSRAQVVIEDDRSGFEFYASSSAINEIAAGFQTTREGIEAIEKSIAGGGFNLPATVRDAVAAIGLEAFAHQLSDEAIANPPTGDAEYTGLPLAVAACASNPGCVAFFGALASWIVLQNTEKDGSNNPNAGAGHNGGPPLDDEASSNNGQPDPGGNRPLVPPPIPGYNIDYDTVSTAKPGQTTRPTNLEEQVLWNQVLRDPAAGEELKLNDDPRFPKSNKSYDMKYVP